MRHDLTTTLVGAGIAGVEGAIEVVKSGNLDWKTILVMSLTLALGAFSKGLAGLAQQK